MLSIYVASMVFGGLFVGLSVLSGLGSIGDVDKDVEFDKELEFDKDFEVDKDFEFDKDFEVDKDFEFDKDFEVDKDFDVELDTDADVDADADADADKDVEVYRGKPYRPFYSFRFYTFTLAFFGLTGTLATLFGAGVLLGLAMSSTMGALAGFGVTYSLHLANQSEGGRALTARDYSGQMGKVILPIPEKGQGKIQLRMRGQIMEFRAESEDGTAYEPGKEVFILTLEDGVAKVADPSALVKRRS